MELLWHQYGLVVLAGGACIALLAGHHYQRRWLLGLGVAALFSMPVAEHHHYAAVQREARTTAGQSIGTLAKVEVVQSGGWLRSGESRLTTTEGIQFVVPYVIQNASHGDPIERRQVLGERLLCVSSRCFPFPVDIQVEQAARR